MEIRQILMELKYNRGYFPEEALQEARAKKDEIINGLLELLLWSVENIELVKEDSRYIGHYYALFLLAEFQEKRAFPLIVEFFTTLEDDDYDFIKFLIFEDLDCILGSVYNGNLNLLQYVIEDTDIDEYIRETFLSCVLYLYKYEIITRRKLVEYFGYLFKHLKRDKSIVWEVLVSHCASIYAEELVDEIKRAYADDLINTDEIELDFILTSIKDEYYQFNDLEKIHRIDDAIEMLRSWLGDICEEDEKDFYFDMSQQTQKVISELEYYRGYYPASAIEEVLKGDEEMVTGLLGILEWSLENFNIVEADGDFTGSIMAFYLLAKSREKRAFPNLVSFFGRIEDLDFANYGDFVYESLSEILASCFDGNYGKLNRIIINEETDELVRAKFLDCYLVLYANNEISRKKIITLLRKVFNHLERESSLLCDYVLEACLAIFAEELLPEIEELYNDDLVDDYEYPYDEVIKSIKDKEVFEECNLDHYHKFEENIEDTTWWQRKNAYPDYINLNVKIGFMNNFNKSRESFREEQRSRKQADVLTKKIISTEGLPYVRTEEKVGRNDPCPCGSGKKYKKCCGKN